MNVAVVISPKKETKKKKNSRLALGENGVHGGGLRSDIDPPLGRIIGFMVYRRSQA